MRRVRWALGIYRELFLVFLLASPLIAFWFKRSPYVIVTIWAVLLGNGILLRSRTIIIASIGAALFWMSLLDPVSHSVLVIRHMRNELIILLTVGIGMCILIWLVLNDRIPLIPDEPKDPPKPDGERGGTIPP